MYTLYATRYTLKEGEDIMFTLMYPTRIIFGRGVLEQLGREALSWGKKAMVVTGRSAMRRSGVLDKVSSLTRSAKVDFYLFDRVEHDPSLKTVDQGVKFLSITRWLSNSPTDRVPSEV